MRLDKQSVVKPKPVDYTHAALFVSGQLVAEGTMEEIGRRFESECTAHRASVQIRVQHEGKWTKVVRHRLS